jgi:hypothetical protein
MTQVMSKTILTIISMILMALCSQTLWATEASENLLVQFTRGDLSTIERAVQDALDAEPLAGESPGPLSSPYAFGTITARGIRYAFKTRITESNLLQGGIRFKLLLGGFDGLIRRLEMNKSGTSLCTNIPVSSPSSDIPVTVIVHPTVTADGQLALSVSEATFDLNDNNFDVQYPETCNVLFGLNWLVRWTLPSLIEGYKETISSALSQALAKGLSERTAELSPMLSLNVTLPFEGQDVPSFNAQVSVHPSRLDINADRFVCSFATSLTIDPDQVSSFSSNNEWPSHLSFFGVSWQTLDAMLAEAQSKGIIRARLRGNHGMLGRALSHDMWVPLFPNLHSVMSADDPLEVHILGAESYKWSGDELSPELANLDVQNLTVTVNSPTAVIAKLRLNAKVVFQLTSNSNRLLKGSLIAVEFTDGGVIANSGLLADDYAPSGLPHLAEQVSDLIQKSPASARSLFEIKLPSIKIGQHQVVVSQAQTYSAGLILPLHYERPH